MNFPFYIAKRYLFTKTSNNAINIISIIASFGVIISSLALFIILSGFSGLKTFNYSLLDVSDPDIKITSTKGKSFIFSNVLDSVIANHKQVKESANIIEERVFLEYNKKNEIAYIKGVAENYQKITLIDSAINVGTWIQKKFENTAVIGEGISRKLSLGILNFGDPLSVMIPKPGTGFINPVNGFYTLKTQIVGVYSGNEDFANKYVFVNLSSARKLLQFKENQITGIEIKLQKNSKPDRVAKELKSQLGIEFKVQTKEQLNEVFYKVINTENFVSYLIFTLIVIIALFNVIGAIIMMIIDKKHNLRTLLNLGSTIKEIKQIFVFQGFLLTVLGMFIGLILGILLVFAQRTFGFFEIVPGLPYPVEFRFLNLTIVLATITILGFIAAKIASSRINKEFIER
ncbi:ABC transporter permease [Polaribacter aquimarinus]|uniref:ABC transporter permease n=1 Tax=Polaribacter aquimarinus TaxID=2100726 RepID=A0A2U2JB54_9FLAO|nr:ABC transporter permease [Polaribacter aquimarinus]PWG05563.1 ABC transporter permease [Polaribacter aquimarinus]